MIALDGTTTTAPRVAVPLMLLGGAFLAVLAGYVVATGSVRNIALTAGIILLPLVFAAPVRPTIAVTLLVGFIVSGMVGFFLRFEQMHWIVAFLFAALMVRFPLLLINRPHPTHAVNVSPVLIALLCYCAAVLTSTLANMPPLLQAIAGMKHFVLPLGLLAVVACTPAPAFWLKVWKAIPLVVIAQFPVALLQRVLYVHEIETVNGTVVTWDAVVGTFGGNPEGGGASGALAFFLCFGSIATAALLRSKLIGKGLAWCAWLSALAVMLLAEIKVLIVLVPFALLAYHRRALLRSPLMLLGCLAGSAVFVVGLLTAYSVMHYRMAGLELQDPIEMIEYMAKAEGTADAHNAATGELSRVGALQLWWTSNPGSGDVSDALIGHGPAASKKSNTFGYGQAAKRHRFILNASTLTAALWDLGLIGTLSLCAVLGTAAWTAFSSAARFAERDPPRFAILESCGVGALLLLACLPYNVDAIDTSAIQMLLAVVVGLAMQMGTHVSDTGSSPGDDADVPSQRPGLT